MMNRNQLARVAFLLCLPALFLLAARIALADGIPAQEAGLNPAGIAYQVNPDAGGNLWISDYGAYEVWRVDPATSVYTIYRGMANVTDARKSTSQEVWWVDS